MPRKDAEGRLPEGSKAFLALGPLEAPTSTTAAVFFALFHPGVAGQEPGFAQGLGEGTIVLDKGTGYPQDHGPGLTGIAAAIYIDEAIKVALGLTYSEDIPHHLAVFLLGEIIVQFTLIYKYGPVSEFQAHPGYGGLSPASTPIISYLLSHLYSRLRGSHF